MKEYGLIRKIVLLVIVCLIIGTTIIPSINGNIEKSNNIINVRNNRQEDCPIPFIKLDRPESSKNWCTGFNLRNEFLLIPDSITDTIGMYDTYNGTYLGDLINGSTIFSTPINAILGPDGNIYVSDQVADSVFVFDISGNYLYTYADGTDGLNNIRGIDFRGNHLFITSGDDYVAEFDGPHSRLPDFINDGIDPFDILFLDDGRALVSDIQGTTDNVRLYMYNGTLESELFQVNFPQQIQVDSLQPGEYLNIAFSDDYITDFDLNGSIAETTPFNSGRGIFRLGNGNLLATAGDGVWEIEPGTGAIIEQKMTGSARFIELISQTSHEVLITSLLYNWNFISLPFNQSANKTNILVRYGGTNYTWAEAVTNGYINDYVFGWNRLGQSYIFADTLEPGYGYWVYAYNDCELWIENMSFSFDNYITDLETGWNIVGVPYDQNVNKTNLLVNDIPWADAASAGIINDFVFGWSRTGQSYTFADTFEPGYSYWVYAYQQCTLGRS